MIIDLTWVFYGVHSQQSGGDLTAETVPPAAGKAPAKKEKAKKVAPVQTTKKADAPAVKPARKAAK